MLYRNYFGFFLVLMGGRREQAVAKSRWRNRDCCISTSVRWKARFVKFEKTHSLLQGRNLTTRYKGKRFLCALNFSQFTLDNLCTKLQNVKAKNPHTKIAPLKILKIAATNFLANLCCHIFVCYTTAACKTLYRKCISQYITCI